MLSFGRCTVAAKPVRHARGLSALSTGPYKLLTYTYVDNILELRVPHRPGHLELAQQWKDDGKLLNGGPLLTEGKPTGGFFVFDGSLSADDIEQQYVCKDPYVTHGLVPSVDIQEWDALM